MSIRLRLISDELKRIRENHIRVRAYYLWRAANEPPDKSLDFWLEAEREYLQLRIKLPHLCQN